VLGVGSGQTDDCTTTSVYNVYTDNHGVLHVVGDVDLVEILTDLGVNLFKDVRVNGDLGPVDSGAQNELRGDALLV
jgi:hypothetical protein